MNVPSDEERDNILENHEKFRISSQTKRIAILLCCNSSGTEKLEPLISNPYTVEKSQDGTRQKRREPSGISDDNFAIWLEKLNTQMSNTHRNILLLLSRERIRSLHNFQRLSNVKLVFLPKDFPTQLRPLRGDVFHSIKMTYRRRYVEFVRRRDSVMREWNTREIVRSVFEAWQQISQELIVSSFQRTKFREDETSLKIQCAEWDSFETGMSFHKYVTFDDELCDASNPRNNDETTFSSFNTNEHRYNLRKSCRETVDLSDGSDEILEEKSRKVRKVIKRKKEITNNDKCDEIPFNGRLSSRMTKLQKSRENHELTNSRMVQFSDIPSTDKSVTIVSDVTATGTISVGTATSSFAHAEIVNSSMSKIYENPEKRKILMDRCLRGVNFANSDSRTETSSKMEDLERFRQLDANSALGVESDDRDGLWEKEVKNFPGEAGPSGKDEYYESRGISQNANTEGSLESEDEEAQDDEETAENDGELRLKILNAIQLCEELDGCNEPKDPNTGRSKRSRACSNIDGNHLMDNDEPPNKLARTDSDWSKCYETNFVFGPEMSTNINENLPQSSLNDNPIDQQSSTTNKSLINRTGNEEVDKRWRFILEDSTNSPNESVPNTKD